jgi:KUP system potassium uptake protein
VRSQALGDTMPAHLAEIPAGAEAAPPAPLVPLALAVLGIVFGDIGTSPLYALKEAFASPHHPVPITGENVLGVLSLVFWSLIVVVSVKYVAFIMRADNRGEGGIMALMALALRSVGGQPRLRRAVLLLGLCGAALFYGDGVVTPAISVLSAVEGLKVAAPRLEPFVIPLTLGILIGLFLLQRRGTGRVGALFGPVMLVWFIVLGLLGTLSIALSPAVLYALDPRYGLAFLWRHQAVGYFVMGAVFLSLTGAEALYADLGHFGRHPIRLAWFALVLPALGLNYFGQGALLLRSPEAVRNPFFHLAPEWALYPLIALATVATVIASQAVISGAFSITQQAIQLGYAPRFKIQHTSPSRIGQIYVPGINWTLLVAVVLLVLGFGSSDRLAAAYGIAVSGTMAITTVLAFVVVRSLWQWSWPRTIAVLSVFAVIDLAFVSANFIKIRDGGWFPLVFGLLVFTLLSTWKRGRELLQARIQHESISWKTFMASFAAGHPERVSGTAVYLTSNPDSVPRALLHTLKHFRVLHERVLIVNVAVRDVPRVGRSERIAVEALGEQFYRIRVVYGFMNTPDLPRTLQLCADQGLSLEAVETTYFLSRETPIPRVESEMSLWREKLFIAMYRNSGSTAEYFNLPPSRVVELGSQVVL